MKKALASILLALTMLAPVIIFAQIEKIYDEHGMLRAINPINEEGLFEGIGYSFYDDGSKKEEIPYKEGEIHGSVKEYHRNGKLKSVKIFRSGKQEGTALQYFPDGHLKMRQDWQNNMRNGPMEVFYQNGNTRIFSQLKNDSILFAQQFDINGQLLSEKTGFINHDLDTTSVKSPVFFLETGSSLQEGLSNRAQIFIPGFPTSFLSFSSLDGEILESGDERFPLLIKPNRGIQEFQLYVLIKTKSTGNPQTKRKISIPIR